MASNFQKLKANLGLGQEDYQQAVTNEFLCMVTGCAWGQMYVNGCPIIILDAQ